jgi:trans-aconitate 2-methyltransferase
MPAWDDAQYLKFVDARTRPAAELLARVHVALDVDAAAAARVIDLGCGPGNSTELLVQRFPHAQIIGVDSSEPMLKSARAALPQREFVLADVTTYQPEQPADVLFANALFQWVPDHERVFPKLLGMLRPGGWLAIQMPDNFHEPSHRLMREVILRYVPDLGAVKRHPPILTSAQYYDLLAPRAKHIDIWQTRYEQVMPDAAAIVEWVKGTGLRPFLEALEPADQAAFLRDYEQEVAKAYPKRADGKLLFPFPRLFIVCSVA